MENKTFLYFAYGYGSNLLTERIRINNRSAKAKGIGVLKKYYSTRFQQQIKGVLLMISLFKALCNNNTEMGRGSGDYPG